MAWRQRVQTWPWGKVMVGVSAVTGALVAVYLQKKAPQDRIAETSWTTNFEPSVKWDNNWDRRDPASLVKPPKDAVKMDEKELKNHENELLKKKPTATRHLLLIRHGNYNTDGKLPEERILTKLGREQAAFTGLRLKALDKPYLKLVSSTKMRAVETADIIKSYLPKDLAVEHSDLLCEGFPIPPEPPMENWAPPDHEYYKDGPRIEGAFRKYFHRASPNQETDSYEVIVCHGNAISYFVCRALQFAPEGWLRMSLYNGSLTWLSIRPSGRVTLRVLGDVGFMPPEKISFM